MKSWATIFCLIAMSAHPLPAQRETEGSPAGVGKKTEKKEADEENKSPFSKLFGDTNSKTSGPTTTEIFADEAFFDSSKSMGTFSGHVKVVDQRFNLQADKLTVFIAKGEQQGLEKAIAEGNVAVVRDRPDAGGGSPSRAVGRADNAVYTAANGNVELKGTPRVQQGENTHVATSPDTVMIINQSGQLTTRGPSRTDIRQQPKDEAKGNGKKKKDDDSTGATKAEKTQAPENDQ